MNVTASNIYILSSIRRELEAATGELGAGRKNVHIIPEREVILQYGQLTYRGDMIEAQLSRNVGIEARLDAVDVSVSQIGAVLADALTKGIETMATSDDTLGYYFGSSSEQMVELLNSTDGNRYFFGGQNVASAPLLADASLLLKRQFDDLLDSAVETSVVGSGEDQSGHALSDLISQSIDFLASDDNWREISQATSAHGSVPISDTRSGRLPISANDTNIRRALVALSIGQAIAESALPRNDKEAAAAFLLGVLQESQTMLIDQHADLGLLQSEVSMSSNLLSQERSQIEEARGRLTQIDAAQTATRAQELSIALETMLVLISRISRLNLADKL